MGCPNWTVFLILYSLSVLGGVESSLCGIDPGITKLQLKRATYVMGIFHFP